MRPKVRLTGRRFKKDYRSYLNKNPSESSCLTVETSRAISWEVSTQMSKKFEEMQTNLKSQTLDVIDAAIENKVLPGIKSPVKTQSSDKKRIWTFRQMDRNRVISVKYSSERTSVK